MVSGRKIAGLLIAVTVAATLFMPIVNSIGDSTGTVEVDNEEWVASYNDSSELEGYNLDSGETVEYYDGETETWNEATSGTDYELNATAGEITILEGGAISEGDDVRASYTYEATDGMTDTVVTLIPLFVGLLILVTLAGPIIDEV